MENAKGKPIPFYRFPRLSPGKALSFRLKPKACPQAVSQTESLDWLSCLEGKSVQGHDAENAAIPCSGKFLSGSRFEFNYNGKTYSSSNPASWSLGSFENHVDDVSSKRQLSGMLISTKAEPNSIQSLLFQYTAEATLNQLQVAVFGATETNQRMICTVE